MPPTTGTSSVDLGPRSGIKVFRETTHRVRLPAETWQVIAPRLHDYGITRMADVTGLDTLGVPVFMAVRPLAKTLTVSQGKGGTAQLAKISAAMEAIELWHAEHACPSPSARSTSIADMDLPYDASALDAYPGGLLGDDRVLDWIDGRGVLTGGSVPVPREVVELVWTGGRQWTPRSLKSTSNGLASGNSRDEATVHALYEVVERDSRTSLTTTPIGERTHVDPHSVDDITSAPVLQEIIDGGTWVEIVDVANRWGVPCYVVYLWSEDFPAIAAGSGAHADPAVALSRALTEAAQSRLTVISGTRDDITIRPSLLRLAATVPPVSRGRIISWSESAARYDADFGDVASEVAWLSSMIAQEVGHEPIVVDLSTSAEFAVVKVVCAGLGYDSRHEVPRPR